MPERVSKILIQRTSKYELGGAERYLQACSVTFAGSIAV
jgi:hypothetical protein